MKALQTLAITLFVGTVAAQGGFVDFEDLTLGDQLTVGNTWNTGGVTLTGQTYYWMGGGSTDLGHAEVHNAGEGGGSGQDVWTDNINLDFDFGTPVIWLILDWGEYGGDINFEINGDRRIVSSLTALDGQTVGGATITANYVTHGILTATGTINSFSLGGQEFTFDSVEYMVPEPGSLSLLALAGLVALRRRG